MSKFLRVFITFLVCICTATTFSGCGEGIIYQKKEEVADQYKVVDENSLMPKIYYIKDGTRFYPLAGTEVAQTDTVPNPANDFLIYPETVMEKVPTLYKNETICIKQGTSSGLSSLPVIRYKNVGYTTGIYGLAYDATMGYYTTSNDSVSKQSSAYEVISNLVTADSFSVRYVDNNEFNVSKSGTILGLEKGGSYTLDLYAGTNYAPVKISADVVLYQSSEGFALHDGVLTKLGYMAFKMPDGAKSGYYRVSNYVFRYIEDTKTQVKEEYDMNVPNSFEGITYAIDDTMQPEEKDQAFSTTDLTNSVKINFSYSNSDAVLMEACVISPSGKETSLKLDPNNMTVTSFSPTESGRHTLRIKGLNTSRISAEFHMEEGTPTQAPTPTPKQTPTPEPEPVQEEPEDTEPHLDTYVEDESVYTYTDENGNEVEVHVSKQVQEEYDGKKE